MRERDQVVTSGSGVAGRERLPAAELGPEVAAQGHRGGVLHGMQHGAAAARRGIRRSRYRLPVDAERCSRAQHL